MRTVSRQRLRRGVRVWSSAPDAPRLRRPTDILLLVGAGPVSAIIGVALHHQTGTPPSGLTLTGTLAGAITGVAELVYALLVLWAALLALLAVAARGRRRLVLDYVVGATITVGVGVLVSRPVGGGWSDTLHQILTSSPSPVDVVGPLAIATVVVVIASPHLTRPLRWTGRSLVALGGAATLLLGITHPVGGVTAILVGTVAAAFTHLALGTPSGYATSEQVARSLPDIGVEVTSLVLAPAQRLGVSTFHAVGVDGGNLVVTQYGRDAWDEQFVGSFWTALTRKGETLDVLGGRRHRVEREALTSLLAERAGVPVLEVVAAGVTADGDAVLVTRASVTSLARLSGDELDPAVLASAWTTLLGLHGLGIAHRDLDASCFVRRADGALAITHLGDARHAADMSSLMIDRVRLLVATATAAGHHAALDAAVDALGPDGVAEMLPYLQAAVLDRVTRRTVSDREWSLDDLRTAAVEATGVEPAALLNVRRVTVKSVGVVVLVGVMAYVIVGMLTDVDLSSIEEELASADKTWLWVALAMSPFVQTSFAFATMGAATARLRYFPVLLLEYAIQFIALTLPATAARLALSVRFFQKFGIPSASAVSMGVIDSFMGFLVQVVLLLVILVSDLPGLTAPLRGTESSTSSTSSTSSGESSTPTLLILIAVLLVVGALVTALVPPVRHRVVGRIPRIREMVREQAATARTSLEVLRHPGKIATMLLGNLGAQVLQAAILGVCLYAFGHTAHMSQLILINTGVSLFAGLMPVPGGMGVAEAGYTAGLQAIGVPSSVAVSTAIAFRMVTFYLPPIWGSVSMRWLRRHEYV